MNQRDPGSAPPLDTRRILDQVSALRYVNVDHAPTYRAIIQVFFEARQRYRVEMRPADVLRGLAESGLFYEVETDRGLDGRLDQLVEWGNLARTHDTDSVTRLEDFYARRFRYHLTSVGEAAHRAVLSVEAAVGRTGSLQASMLGRIRESVEALARAGAGADPERLFGLLHDLHKDFSTLTEEANRFIGELNTAAGSIRLDEELFRLRKEALLLYISRFVEQLRSMAGAIQQGIRVVETAGLEPILRQASRSGDLPPALGDEDPALSWMAEQRGRWEGMRAWFLGTAEERPTVDRLAEVAVQAVVGLARTLGRLNDRRVRPVDRAADLRVLARWFAASPSEIEAHRLFQQAFGLHGSRHFHLAEEDAELASPRASWWDAPPVEIPIRMRQKGKLNRSGKAAAVPDRSQEREFIAARRARERAQLEAVMRHFTDRERFSISDLKELDLRAFDQLLGLLDEALAAPRDPDGAQEARTADGRYRIRLRRPAGDPPRLVRLETPAGTLCCLDYELRVERTRFQAPLLAAGGAR